MAELRKQKFRSLEVKAKQKCRSVETELHILGDNSRMECGSGTSDLWQTSQRRSAEAELQFF